MQGIWKYSEKFRDFVEEKFRLTLNEGNTPLEKIKIDNQIVYLKREDKNPSGSQKDRSLAYQLSALSQQNVYHYCISSSGNAAISAAIYFQLIEETIKRLSIFISAGIPEYKRKRLMNAIGTCKDIHVHESKNPKKTCIQYANQFNAHNLRGSTDPLALEGFKTIGFELQEELTDTDAIFIPTSSATTLLGTYYAYDQNKHSLPAFHLVQTTKINTISKDFDNNFLSEKKSHASAITDIIAYRKNDAEEAIRNSQGSAWTICEDELLDAKKLFNDLNLKISYDSCLSLAGLLRAKKLNPDQFGNYKKPVLLITGV